MVAPADPACLRAHGSAGSRSGRRGSAAPTSKSRAARPAAPPRPGGLRIAYLVYRGNPRCGGQGVYTRHLARELVGLGHSVEVFVGPALARARRRGGVHARSRASTCTETPTRSGCRTRASSPTRSTFSNSASCARPGSPSRGPSPCGRGGCWPPGAATSTSSTTISASGRDLLGMIEDGWPLLTTLHHPITVDRELALSHAENAYRRLTQRRWFGFLGHADAGGAASCRASSPCRSPPSATSPRRWGSIPSA